MIGEVPASRLRENTEGLQTTESTVLNYINSECTFFFFSLRRRLRRAPQRLSHPRYRNPAAAAGACAHLRQLLLPRPNLFAASLEGWPAGSPLAGPLLGGVVRADDLRLRHHSVLVLREGVAVWKEAFQTVSSSGSPWTKAKKRINWMTNYFF